jgi:hypothetical protein
MVRHARGTTIQERRLGGRFNYTGILAAQWSVETQEVMYMACGADADMQAFFCSCVQAQPGNLLEEHCMSSDGRARLPLSSANIYHACAAVHTFFVID